MIQQDYIMRLIEQLVKILTKVIFNKQEEKFSEAIEAIDTALNELVGVDYNFVKTLPESDLLTFLRINKDEQIIAGKCIIIAKLLTERAKISCLIDQKYDPISEYCKALRLYVEGLQLYLGNEVFLKNSYNDVLELKALLGDAIPPDLIRNIERVVVKCKCDVN